jgi:hypothetical protein
LSAFHNDVHFLPAFAHTFCIILRRVIMHSIPEGPFTGVLGFDIFTSISDNLPGYSRFSSSEFLYKPQVLLAEPYQIEFSLSK